MNNETQMDAEFLHRMQKLCAEKLKKRIKEDIIKERFPDGAPKKVRERYMRTPQYSEEKSRRLSEMEEDPDSEYRVLMDRPWEYPEIVSLWEENQEEIRKEISEKGSFSIKSFNRYLTDKERAMGLEKRLVNAGLIKPGSIPAEERVINHAAEEIADRIGRYLESGVVMLDGDEKENRRHESDYHRSRGRTLDHRSFPNLVEMIRAGKDHTLRRYAGINSLSEFIEKSWYDVFPGIREKKGGKIASGIIKASGKEARRRCREVLAGIMTRDRIVEHLSKNPAYQPLAERLEEDIKISSQLEQYLEGETASDYTMLYPRARKMKRHFTLHIGPTNSGKTHDAMEDLIKAETGTYLAPLRLMAYEQYEAVTEAGVGCRMLTGEEEIGDPDASHVSSTIEMADYRTEYDVAVIDEAQMIADMSRGGAWTSAILGIRAKRVHVCAAPEAEEIVTRLIKACNDDMELVRHERLVPIRADDHRFRFPKSTQKGDALVVFSRKSVHAVANVLQNSNIPCSVIYGALPYDVRHEEVRKFREGETTVVVATDAIGMGMNLPIRRVVFIEEEKFDGENRRRLEPGEIRQIAGRAGRYGIYDMGIYSCSGDIPALEESYNTEPEQIRNAVVSIPGEILGFDARLSGILAKWAELPVQKGFIKMSVEREIKLAEKLESISNDKELIYEFINLKFDEDEPTLMYIWEMCFRTVLGGGDVEELDVTGYADESTMSGLELLYRQCDLMYSIVQRMNPQSERLKDIDAERRSITKRLIELLKDQEFEGRKCRRCGRPLPFGYRYGVCEKCFEKTKYRRALDRDEDDRGGRRIRRGRRRGH